MTPRKVFGIPGLKHVAPLTRPPNRNKSVAHFQRSRMQSRILDAKLPHLSATDLGAVDLLGQPVMLCDHVALLEETRRIRQRKAGGERSDLLENPRISDCSAGHSH